MREREQMNLIQASSATVRPMIVIAMASLILLFSAASTRSLASDPLTPIGIWATPGDESHVRIAECGERLCGTIVWLKDPLGDDGKDALDSNNPDPGLRSRKILGLPLLHDFVRDKDDPSLWTDGTIYDPENGKTYSCRLTVEATGTLRVRGYVGLAIFGETQTWTRVE